MFDAAVTEFIQRGEMRLSIKTLPDVYHNLIKNEKTTATRPLPRATGSLLMGEWSYNDIDGPLKTLSNNVACFGIGSFLITCDTFCVFMQLIGVPLLLRGSTLGGKLINTMSDGVQ